MASKSPSVEIDVDGRVVRVSNPDRVYFPATGATKLDLVDYYLAVGPGIVNALRERPCMLHRFPTGLAGEKVHQKRIPAGAPDWLETVQLHFPRWNRTADELCVTELASVIWAVQMSTVEFHPWNSRRADTEQPDEWRIDLDPGEECDYATVQRVAHVAHEVLEELGATGFPKTSGGSGMHVYVRVAPDHGFKDVRRAALAFAREVERRAPDDVTTTWWRKDRDPAKLFVDYNQNLGSDLRKHSDYGVSVDRKTGPSVPVLAIDAGKHRRRAVVESVTQPVFDTLVGKVWMALQSQKVWVFFDDPRSHSFMKAKRTMPAPRLLPDNETLKRLRAQGWSYVDIAREYGVSKGAVYLQLEKAGNVTRRPSYKHLIPWTVRSDHQYAHPATMLRLVGRREAGSSIPDVKSRMLDKWLRELRDNNVVVCYHPDMPPNAASPSTGGWYYSTRKPTDDPDVLVRYEPDAPAPKIENNGAKVPH